MKIAIVTGASAGLGREFVQKLHENYPEVECIWAIARREDKLIELGKGLGSVSLRPVPMDLCLDDSYAALQKLLEAEKPDVRLLVNNAGCGYLGNLGEADTAGQIRMVDLNLKALTAVTNIVIPYMSRGGNIILVSSIASFCPNPRMTVYSSTKAYVSSFARGLSEELRAKGIGVTAVCPGPMKTDFLDAGGITGNSKMFETLPYTDPKKVVEGTYKAARSGKVIYTPGAFFKFYRVLAKLLPHALVVKLAKT